MTAPTRRHVIAGSLAALGAAGAPAIANAAVPHSPPTTKDWTRLFVALRKLTPEQTREALAYAEELLAEQQGRA